MIRKISEEGENYNFPRFLADGKRQEQQSTGSLLEGECQTNRLLLQQVAEVLQDRQA
jgi:hypothetical protein